MKVVGIDNRKCYSGSVLVEFTVKELGEVGIYTTDSYGSITAKNEDIAKAISSVFKANRAATSIAVNNFHPAKILHDTIKQLSEWMDAAASVSVSGTLPVDSDQEA